MPSGGMLLVPATGMVTGSQTPGGRIPITSKEEAVTPETRAVIERYRDRLAGFQRLQEVPGSTWTDAMVAEAMAPHRREAEDALYRQGFNRDELMGLLAEPHAKPRPARDLGEWVNRLLRGGPT